MCRMMRGRERGMRATGTANAARVSKGSRHDVWDGLSIKDPKRHPGQHITVTCVIYNTIAGGVPSEADVMAAVEDMEQLYVSCGQGKHGRLANPEFDFVKKELTVKDLIDCTSPSVVDSDIFPTDGPAPAPTPAPAPAPGSGSQLHGFWSGDGAKPASSTTTLGDFLRKRGLAIYQQKLMDVGWDDLAFLRTRSEAELKDIATSVGMKPGHTAKFNYWILQSINSIG